MRFRRAYRSSRSACHRSRSVEIWTEVSSIMRPLPRIRAMLPEGLHYFQRSNWSRTQNVVTATAELEPGISLSSLRSGFALVLFGALLFAAGGNVVKAFFKLGYSPLVLAQMRIWW